MNANSFLRKIKKWILGGFLFCFFIPLTYTQVFNGTTGAIEDESCLIGNTFTANVTGCNIVLDKITLNITHPDAGENLIFLEAPNGNTLELSTLNGLGAANFTNTEFTDNAASFITVGAPPFTGQFRPEGRADVAACADPLGAVGIFTISSQFGNIDPNGLWKLHVRDFRAINMGTLDSWALTFVNAPPQSDDVAVASVSPVTNGNCFGNAESIEVTITNNGSNDVQVGAVSVELTGAENSPFTLNNNILIAACSTGIITFTDVDLTAPDNLYTLTATATLSGDGNALNDAASSEILNDCGLFFGNTGPVADDACPAGSTFINTVSGLPNQLGLNLFFDKLAVNIQHHAVGQLLLFLEAPTGSIMEISTNNGGTGFHYFNSRFSDMATTFVTTGNPPFNSTFKPEGRTGTISCNPAGNVGDFTFASQFDGTDPNGDWRLHLIDDTAGDLGTLFEWSLDFIVPNSDKDVALIMVESPAKACLGSSETVAVSIQNMGADPLAVGAANVELAGAENSPLNLANTSVLNFLETEIVTFNNVDFSGEGVDYNLTAIVTLAGDEVPSNDTGTGLAENTCDEVSFPGAIGGLGDDDCPTGTTFTTNITVCDKVLEKITLDISHTFDSGLQIFLEAPNGNVLELSTGNGGSGNDYTNTCFSDAAAIFIIEGDDPFEGEFKPEGRADTLACNPGGNVGDFTIASQFGNINPNGEWKLHILDDAGGDVGTLNAWSLTFANGVTPHPSDDVFVVSIDRVPMGVCFENTETLEVTITNNGSNDIPIGAVSVELTGAENGPFTLNNSNLLQTCESEVLTFTGVDLSAVDKLYTLTATATLNGDQDASNDTFTRDFLNSCGIFQGGTGDIEDDACSDGTTFINVVENMPNQLGANLLLDKLTLNIDHTFDSDLLLFLEGPNANILELSTNNGSSLNNYTNTEFTDAAPNFITEGTAPFTGPFKPEGRTETISCSPSGNLGEFSFASQFEGSDPNGNWLLHIIDDSEDDEGTLLGWSLHFIGTNGVVDVAVTSVVTPLVEAPDFGCFGNAETVEVTIRNFGIDPIAIGAVNVELAGAENSPLNMNNAILLNSFETEVLVFNNVDLSGNGVHYNLTATATLVGDEESANDVLNEVPENTCDDFLGSTGNIIDNNCHNGTDFTTVVSGLGGELGCDAKIEYVRVFLTHDDISELQLFLIHNSMAIDLAIEEGGAANHYTNTQFMDEAPQFITAGIAPFNGAFKPEGREDDSNCNSIGDIGDFTLASAFDGLDPNGTWTLRVQDTDGGNIGTVDFWSIAFTIPDFPPVDVAVLEVNSPTAACFGNSETVQVTIQNRGDNDIQVGEVSLQLDGAENSPIILANTTLIPRCSTELITFNGVDLSVLAKFYDLMVTVSLANDANTANDSKVGSTQNTCPPPNDDCATAIPLVVGSVNNCTFTTATNASASVSANSPCFNVVGLQDIWYSFTATTTAHNILINLLTAQAMRFAVYESCGGAEIYCRGLIKIGEDNLVPDLVPGNTYFILVTSLQANAGFFEICVRESDILVFDGATGSTTDFTCSSSGDDFSMTVSGLSNSLGCNVFLEEMLLRVIISRAGDLQLFLENPSGEILELSTQNSGGTNQNYFNTSFTDDTQNFPVDEDAPFATRVRPEGKTDQFVCNAVGTDGTFTFANKFNDTDPNGTWILRVKDGIGNVTGTIERWSLFFTEPTTIVTDAEMMEIIVPSANCFNNSETVDIVVRNLGTADIAVGALNVELTGAENSPLNLTNNAPIPSCETHTVSFTNVDLSQTGITYNLNAVITLSGDQNPGNDTGSVTSTNNCPPSNDDCANAIALTVGLNNTCNPTFGSIDFALNALNNPSCFSPGDDLPDVWYSFTATNTIHSILFNLLSAPSMGLAVFDACSGTELMCLETIVSGSDNPLSGLTIGNTYFVQVLNINSELGSFEICVKETDTFNIIGEIGDGQIFDDLCPTVQSFAANLPGMAGTLGTDIFLQNVVIDISHSFVADLQIYMEDAIGNVIDLATNVGASGDDFANTRFTDFASTSITNGTAPFTGIFKPEGSIDDPFVCNPGGNQGTFTFSSQFNGQNPAGEWDLLITDVESGDAGTLNSWFIIFTTFDPSSDIDGDGFSLAIGDCDDSDNTIFPGAPELCDGKDNDCNGNPESTINTWTGAGDGLLWTGPANWSDGIVPLECQDVVIPAGQTVTVPAGFEAKGKTLDVSLGANLTTDPTATMDIGN